MKFLTILALAFLLLSCKEEAKQITNQNDYKKYLEIEDTKSLEFAKGEIDFWQKKFDAAPNQISYLTQIAANYAILFEKTGNINNLLKTEELLLKSNEALNYGFTAPIRSLARNYISQHRFREALVLAQKALVLGDGMKETQKLLFDVNMELGNYAEAEKNLQALDSVRNFDYFIRYSKWSDHLGNLERAISFMEKAKETVEFDNNKALKIWVYSNLGDLNGHAGNIENSYNYYLKTLELDNNNSYALKGIAWIVFSHERNTVEANRIIDMIAKKHDTPDFYLLKSKIADYENNASAKKENIDKYFQMLASNKYGAMYNKYNMLLYADDKTTMAKALEIAQIEVNSRPTPDSYDLLAWSYYNLGQVDEAFEIAQKYVADKSHEPILNYHLAMIYKAKKMNDKVSEIKKDLQGSVYELGPNFEKKIEQL
jgi:lipoprotein NlpI